jgi:hypothetical protein
MGEMYILIIIGAFGPFISATILNRRQNGKKETTKWRKNILSIKKHVKWHLIGGLGIPLIITLLHIGYVSITQGPPLLQTDPPWYWLLPATPINIFEFLYTVMLLVRSLDGKDTQCLDYYNNTMLLRTKGTLDFDIPK